MWQRIYTLRYGESVIQSAKRGEKMHLNKFYAFSSRCPFMVCFELLVVDFFFLTNHINCINCLFALFDLVELIKCFFLLRYLKEKTPLSAVSISY